MAIGGNIIAKQVAMYTWDIYTTAEHDGIVVEHYRGQVRQLRGCEYQTLRATYDMRFESPYQEPRLVPRDEPSETMRAAIEALWV